MKNIPIALQLWSVREEMTRDFAATATAVSRMGYAGVELAGYGNLDCKRVNQTLRDLGLKVAGMHANAPTLLAGVNAVVDDALLLGTGDVVCSWWPPVQLASAAACQKIGEQLNEIGSVLRAWNLRFSYHNHAAEMKVIDGRTALDWILSAAEPRNLGTELDVYWVRHGGQSPADCLNRYGDRVQLIHLKDQKEIGTGPVDFTEIFSAADRIGAVKWYIVEQEEYSTTPLEGVRAGIEQLRRWGRA